MIIMHDIHASLPSLMHRLLVQLYGNDASQKQRWKAFWFNGEDGIVESIQYSRPFCNLLTNYVWALAISSDGISLMEIWNDTELTWLLIIATASTKKSHKFLSWMLSTIKGPKSSTPLYHSTWVHLLNLWEREKKMNRQ